VCVCVCVCVPGMWLPLQEGALVGGPAFMSNISDSVLVRHPIQNNFLPSGQELRLFVLLLFAVLQPL
jgi:hypothetical protein